MSPAAGRRQRADRDEHSLDQSALWATLGYSCRRADLALLSVYRRATRAFNLKPSEFALLVCIRDNPMATQKMLAGALEIAAPNLAVLLDRLQGQGLVSRQRSELDRRAMNIELTTAGRALTDRAERALLRAEATSLDGLNAAEQTQLRRLLAKVVAAVPARARRV